MCLFFSFLFLLFARFGVMFSFRIGSESQSGFVKTSNKTRFEAGG